MRDNNPHIEICVMAWLSSKKLIAMLSVELINEMLYLIEHIESITG